VRKIIYISFLLIIITGCRLGPPPDVTTPVPAVSPEPAIDVNMKPLVFASIPMDNRLKMLEGWSMLADYITQETGIPVDVTIKKSYHEIIEALSSKEVDFCYAGPLIYVGAHEKAGALPLVKPTANGQPFYNSVIIVRKDSGINDIAGLKGRSFAFTDRDSTSGYLFPRAMLAEDGVKSLNFFSKVTYSGGHDSSLEGVYQKYIDGAGIFDYAFVKEKNSKTEDLKILKTSDPIPMGPIVISKNFDPEIAKKLQAVFLTIGKTEETKILAEKIKVDGYVEAKDSDYDSIRKAMSIVKKLGEDYKTE
jgi:phosphonate transport system substrate-binding protein